MANAWTPGPWTIAREGDGKRITIGEGLVEGPNGYDVAEVYSDDCPYELAEANANLIAAAPELYEAVAKSVVELEEAAKLLRSLANLPSLADIYEKAALRQRAALAKAAGRT